MASPSTPRPWPGCGSWGRIKGRLIAEVDRDFGVFVPTGRRPLNPESTFGAAVLQEAAEWSLDPPTWPRLRIPCGPRSGKRSRGNLRGPPGRPQSNRLTARRIGRWEDAGKRLQLPSRPRHRRPRAGRPPTPPSGIGPGYDGEDGGDDTDYAGRLWDVLREHDENNMPKHASRHSAPRRRVGWHRARTDHCPSSAR